MKKLTPHHHTIIPKKEDGYLTIELTMIFPVIFFSLILILYMGIVLYQEVNAQSLAVEASERGSVVYSFRVADMTTGIKTLEDFKYRDPYRNVPFMGGGDKKTYTALVNQYVAERLDSKSVLEGTSQNGGNYTQVEDYLIAKRVKVNIRSAYTTPADSIAEMFGHRGPFEVDTCAVSAVTDPADFVRNVDIVTDVAGQTKVFGKVEEGYNKIKKAIEKVADLLK